MNVAFQDFPIPVGSKARQRIEAIGRLQRIATKYQDEFRRLSEEVKEKDLQIAELTERAELAEAEMRKRSKAEWGSTEVFGTSGTIPMIRRIVARHYGLAVVDLVAERRTKVPTHARHVAMYLARTLTPFSLPRIGRFFGKRDHTTVLHACRRIARLLKSDAELLGEIGELSALIEKEIAAEALKANNSTKAGPPDENIP